MAVSDVEIHVGVDTGDVVDVALYFVQAHACNTHTRTHTHTHTHTHAHMHTHTHTHTQRGRAQAERRHVIAMHFPMRKRKKSQN